MTYCELAVPKYEVCPVGHTNYYLCGINMEPCFGPAEHQCYRVGYPGMFVLGMFYTNETMGGQVLVSDEITSRWLAVTVKRQEHEILPDNTKYTVLRYTQLLHQTAEQFRKNPMAVVEA